MLDISSLLTAQDIQRFWSRVARCSHGQQCARCCWLWTKACTATGYGSLRIRRQEEHNADIKAILQQQAAVNAQQAVVNTQNTTLIMRIVRTLDRIDEKLDRIFPERS